MKWGWGNTFTVAEPKEHYPSHTYRGDSSGESVDSLFY